MRVQVWRIRKILRLAAVKSQIGCLLSRLGSVEARRKMKVKVVQWEKELERDLMRRKKKERTKCVPPGQICGQATVIGQVQVKDTVMKQYSAIS